MFTRFSKAECRAIEQHQAVLSVQHEREVPLADALDDWLTHWSQQWREERQANMLAMEREEILRHKWLESEKQKRDVGSDAVFDWIRRYAPSWRKWFEENSDTRNA